VAISSWKTLAAGPAAIAIHDARHMQGGWWSDIHGSSTLVTRCVASGATGSIGVA
jgi:hypothetical protein